MNVAIDQFGPISFLVMDEQAKENKAGPITYINENMAPLLVQHGMADRLVPYQQSEMFVKAVREKLPDAVVEFTSFPTADHEDKQYGTEENIELLWKFIRKYL